MEVRRIQERHLIQDFTDIGCHFLISPCGTVYEGRAGGKNIRGEHAFGFNDDSVSVCLLGRYEEAEQADTFDLDAPNGQSLVLLCLWLLWEIGASAATLAYVLLERAQEPCLIYLAVILIGADRASFNAPGMAILASSGASEDVKLLFSLQFIAINIDATRHAFVSRQLTQSIGSEVKIFGGSVAKSDGSVREAGRALFMQPTVLSQIFIHGRFGV